MAKGKWTVEALSYRFAELPAQMGEMQVLDGGTRLIVTSPGRAVIEAVVEAGQPLPQPLYVGAISDASGGAAPEGVEDLVFTAVFDSEAHAITHVGGLLNSGDTVCAIDRPGVAIKTGKVSESIESLLPAQSTRSTHNGIYVRVCQPRIMPDMGGRSGVTTCPGFFDSGDSVLA
jgi:hypothetical protein